MRSLVLFGPNCSRTRTIAVVLAWTLGGCCASGENGSAQNEAAVTASATTTSMPAAPPTDVLPTTPPPYPPNKAPLEAMYDRPVANAPPAAPAANGERQIAGAAHILVAYKGAERAPKTVTRSKEDAKKRAQEASTKLRAKTATFEELVKQYSDDTISKPAEGRVGNFERNAMPAAFSDATFNMGVDDVSEVVETPLGFHIIKRTK